MKFRKGQTPWNKGKRTGIVPTSAFKKGVKPWNKGELVTLRCEFCDKAFDVHPGREHTARFCRHKCFTDHRKETGDFRGENNPLWGKENLSCKGENNIHWKGGVSKENKNRWSDNNYLHWRKGVFHRDDYTCQECGKRGVYLEAHHIKPWSEYPELRYVENNGITYCKECHGKIDERRFI